MASTSFLDPLTLSPQEIFQPHNLIVVDQNEQVDGSFVLHYLISEFNKISDSKSILLVLNHQNTQHWESVSNKIGGQLSILKDRGQLRIIDLLQRNFDHIMKTCDSEAEPDFTAPLTPLPELHVDNLYTICAEEIQKFSSNNHKLLIVIEDLSNLYYTSNQNELAILEFLRKLRFANSGAIVLTLLSNYTPEKNAAYLSNLITKSLSNISFSVSPLKTGFSKEVNGFLRVRTYNRKIQKERPTPISELKDQKFHFKLQDRGISFVPL